MGLVYLQTHWLQCVQICMFQLPGPSPVKYHLAGGFLYFLTTMNEPSSYQLSQNFDFYGADIQCSKFNALSCAFVENSKYCTIYLKIANTRWQIGVTRDQF